VHVIAGTWEGHNGPVTPLTDVFLSYVTLSGGARMTLPAPRTKNVFFYVVRGTVRVSSTEVSAMHLVEFDDDGDSIDIEASSDALVLFGHATPYDEPVVAHGPFVMNTREEIMQAIRDYQAGLFG
nr:pirin family protein [Acidobacteriota bacterium]